MSLIEKAEEVIKEGVEAVEKLFEGAEVDAAQDVEGAAEGETNDTQDAGEGNPEAPAGTPTQTDAAPSSTESTAQPASTGNSAAQS